MIPYRVGSATPLPFLLILSVILALSGCGQDLDPDSFRTTLPADALASLPPDPEILGHQGEQGTHLWLLRTQTPFEPPEDVAMREAERIPAEVVLSTARALAADPESIGQPVSEESIYLGWTTPSGEYRIRQIETDRGWLLWLEAYGIAVED